MRGRRDGGLTVRLALTVALATGLALPARSASQTVISPAGVDIDDAEIFKPTVDPGSFLSIYDTAILPRGRFTIGFSGDYAREPLTARLIVAGRESNPAIVDNLATANLLGAIGVTPRVQLGAHLPFYLVGESDVRIGSKTLGGTEASFGDLLFNAKIGILSSSARGRGFGLAVIPTLGFPTGNRRGFSGLGDWSYGGLLAADLTLDRWQLGANFGGMVRDGLGDRSSSDHFEDQYRWGFAVARGIAPRTSLIGEAYGLIDAAGGQGFRSPAEILGAIRFAAGPVELTLGAGGGLNSGKNAALFRFVFGVTSTVVTPGLAPAPAADFATSRKSYVVEDYDRNGQVSPGDVIVYTITVANTGAGAVQGIVVVDPIPANTEYVAGTLKVNAQPLADDQGYASTPARIEVHLGSLGSDPGANQATISFKARIRSDLPTVLSVSNQARLSASGTAEVNLPTVETAVFPATAQRGRVFETPPTSVPAKLEITQNIQFEPSGAKLRPESLPVLDEVVSILKERPAIELMIVGHTDNVGGPAANMHLSQQRAEAVKAYLVSKGITASRIEAAGRGASEPIAANDTESGRAANRRVEFLIVRGQ